MEYEMNVVFLWAVIHILKWVALYAAVFIGSTGALNLIMFISWFMFVLCTILVIAPKKEHKTVGSLRASLNLILSVSTVVGLVWLGCHITGFAYITALVLYWVHQKRPVTGIAKA